MKPDVATTEMDRSQIDRTIDAVWRMESARVIAGLTRIVRDVGIAEELAQDALVAALEQWPESGVPQNPGAWLMVAMRPSIARYRPATPQYPAGTQARRARPQL